MATLDKDLVTGLDECSLVNSSDTILRNSRLYVLTALATLPSSRFECPLWSELDPPVSLLVSVQRSECAALSEIRGSSLRDFIVILCRGFNMEYRNLSEN
ncbi:Hypothetical predicted protein [Marmota monax]|uniref:Uncharacterized protein n=1 Tax=Marmota monax TaxID=9995 RepID=A0A5E4C642_MARMO|nr:Hypothetical predicted protein [Marmota monax]